MAEKAERIQRYDHVLEPKKRALISHPMMAKTLERISYYIRHQGHDLLLKLVKEPQDLLLASLPTAIQRRHEQGGVHIWHGGEVLNGCRKIRCNWDPCNNTIHPWGYQQFFHSGLLSTVSPLFSHRLPPSSASSLGQSV